MQPLLQSAFWSIKKDHHYILLCSSTCFEQWETQSAWRPHPPFPIKPLLTQVFRIVLNIKIWNLVKKKKKRGNSCMNIKRRQKSYASCHLLGVQKNWSSFLVSTQTAASITEGQTWAVSAGKSFLRRPILYDRLRLITTGKEKCLYMNVTLI